jgi:hypothetical protein
MGKVRTRILGMEDVEEKQKKKQKEKAKEKALIEKKGEKKAKDVILNEVKDLGAKGAVNASLDSSPAERVQNDSPEKPKKEKKTEKPQKKQESKARVRGKKYKTALKLRSEKQIKQLL